MINKIFLNLKFLVDINLALILLILLSPLFLLVSIVIILDSGLPVFFFQKRVGLNGKLYTMYKFRTMKEVPNFKGQKYHCYEGDERITSTGKYLRKYSLDELPQLFNIIKGQMSFVGPRPAIYDELSYEDIDPELFNVIRQRSSVRPGITGYAQVRSRNDLDWNEKLRLDKHYLSLSPIFRFIEDIIIIIMTTSEIIFTKGAYDKKIDP